LINPEIFREYDIRGIAATELDSEFMVVFSQALAAYFRGKNEIRVIIGRDNRLSSERIRNKLAAGLVANGCSVLDIGVATTPLFYYARLLYNIDAGVMITASHNPAEFNGFKIALGPGTIYGAEIQKLREMALQAESDELQVTSDKLKAESDELQVTSDKLEAESDELQVTSDKLKAESDELQAESDELQVTSDKLKALNPTPDTRHLKLDIQHSPPATRHLTPVTANVETREPVDAYLTMLAKKIKLRRGLKVAVDCGNGTASDFAVKYLEKLGCEVLPLFCESDGNFPNHHPDPVSSANLKFLREAVLRHHADVGIAFDGDGDRLGVVDETGRIIWGDELMVLYWREILPKYPGTPCIVEVKCSQALVEEIERLGGRPEFYKTGHSLIKARMREIGAIFTGEMSGHMFFADDYFGFDDAFYATGRLLRIMAAASQPLSKLLATIPKYFATAETRVPCDDAVKFQVVERLRVAFEKTHQVIAIDGARVLFPEGWGLVRASNTQPALVTRCEARSEKALAEITGKLKEALLAFPEIGEFEWEG
jgi:phosphomannomutase